MAKPCKWYSVCPMKWHTDAGQLDPAWVEHYCLGGHWRECVRYQMEERGEPHPDWMLPDGTLDERLRGR